MMKEFGVKFEQFLYPDFHSLERKLLSVSFERICQNENLNDKIEFENRLIVAEESEHIFEPKEDDSVLTPTGCLAFYDKDLVQNNSRIIMRDGKEFFMPEVGNE